MSGDDWVDDQLKKAEGWPIVGGAVQQLQFAYDVMKQDWPDPKFTHSMGTVLGDLQTTANQLFNELNDSLFSLRPKWSGHDAEAYLGPQATAFQIEHDMEPTEYGIGPIMAAKLENLAKDLDIDNSAHNLMSTRLQQIHNLKDNLTNLFWVAMGTLGVMAVSVEFLPAEAPETAALIAEAADAYSVAVTISDTVVLITWELTTVDVIEVGEATAVTGAIILVFLGQPVSVNLPQTLQEASGPTGGCTEDQINTYSDQAGLDPGTLMELRFAHPEDICVILLNLAVLHADPQAQGGMRQLEADLRTNDDFYQGSFFELQWLAAYEASNPDGLISVEKINEETGHQDADAIIFPNTIVDFKTNSDPRKQTGLYTDQAAKYHKYYQGYAVEYVFDGDAITPSFFTDKYERGKYAGQLKLRGFIDTMNNAGIKPVVFVFASPREVPKELQDLVAQGKLVFQILPGKQEPTGAINSGN